jgi:DNA replication and repair protein RecF
VLAVGPNGAGKTNLLEALHVGTQGFSPRTRRESRLVRFEQETAALRVTGKQAESTIETEVELRRNGGKRMALNGAPVRTMDELRGRISTLVFTPERLAVVKGSPAIRRAYFDRVLTRLLPARASLPVDYSAALGQRNVALRRTSAGLSGRDAIEPWTARLAESGCALSQARTEAVSLLAQAFADRAAELELPDARLQHESAPASVEDLDARLERDLERGWTGAGPHLEDVAVLSGDRDLRAFGSQGEQRIAVLALLLAEAAVLAERGPPPLLLLDEATSSLDAESETPIIGATVSIPALELRTRTDRTGNFSFENLNHGNHTLLVSADGYDEKEQDISLDSERNNVTIELQRAEVEIPEEPREY